MASAAPESPADPHRQRVGKPLRRSGRVVPHQPNFWQRVAARLIWLLVRGLAGTLRFSIELRAPQLLQPGCTPAIYCIWHNRLALSLVVHQRFFKSANPERSLAALVSASRDGALLARVLELFGTQPVRGSSSRRGAQALLELATWSERGFDLAMTPDGPRGPCYQVQAGVIAAAQLTGRAVVPVGIRLSRYVQTRSWDRFQIPLPFSRCHVVVGEPLFLPRRMEAEQRETLRAELEARMISLHEG